MNYLFRVARHNRTLMTATGSSNGFNLWATTFLLALRLLLHRYLQRDDDGRIYILDSLVCIAASVHYKNISRRHT